MKKFLVIIAIIASFIGQTQVNAMDWFRPKTAEQIAAEAKTKEEQRVAAQQAKTEARLAKERKAAYQYTMERSKWEGSPERQEFLQNLEAFKEGQRVAREKICFNNGYQAALKDVASGNQPKEQNLYEPCYANGYMAGREKLVQLAQQQLNPKPIMYPVSQGGCVIQ